MRYKKGHKFSYSSKPLYGKYSINPPKNNTYTYPRIGKHTTNKQINAGRRDQQQSEANSFTSNQQGCLSDGASLS